MEDERPLALSVRDVHVLEVRYRRPAAIEREEEAERPLTLGDTLCEITGQWNVSDSNRGHLQKLAREGGTEFT
jgi:hypothetical protein